MEMELRRLQPDTVTVSELAALTAVMLAAPRYSLCVTGRMPLASDATELLQDLPPGYNYADKYTFGIYYAGLMIGCADILRGWKHDRQSMLGLLLLAEHAQGQGFGRQAYRLLEQKIRSWPNMDSVRIGVISTNADAIAFWRKIGFVKNGETSSIEGHTGPTLIFEKPL